MSESPKPGSGRGRSRLGCFLILAFLAVVAAGIWYFFFGGPAVSPGTVLLLDFEAGLPERTGSGLASLWRAPALDVLELRRALRSAAADENIEGILLRVSIPGLAPGKIEEIRRFLEAFRTSGKFVIAHADAPDTLGYLLATAADEILLDRSAPMSAVGLSAKAFFLKDALAEWGVEADLVRVGKFKGAHEQLTASEPSPAFSEAMDALVDSLFDSVLTSAAMSRKLSKPELAALMNRNPLLADEALKEKLVDRVVYGDEVRPRVEERAGKAVHFQSVSDYLRAARTVAAAEKSFAVVHVVGLIIEGRSRDLLLTGETCGADTVVQALRDAAEDPGMAGILLRIDSQGGSVSAAEKIWRAVDLARKKKPVVASMGATAASGGYYAACAADRVLCQGTSLTGSIGIFGGKIVLGDLLKRHGVGMEEYARGERAGMFDATRPFTAGERQALMNLLETSYRLFVDRAAQGRKKTFEDVEALAQGRIWTGRAALEVGLVDAVGGFEEAVEALKDLAQIPKASPVELRLFPPPMTWFDVLRPQAEGPFVRARGGARFSVELHGEALYREVRSWLEESRLFVSPAGMALMPVALDVR